MRTVWTLEKTLMSSKKYVPEDQNFIQSRNKKAEDMGFEPETDGNRWISPKKYTENFLAKALALYFV